jgi:7,8-dihydroneopterin aldolase/epimerase/oxygenase
VSFVARLLNRAEMSGIIFIRGLHLHARHGDPAHGEECGQRLVIDLDLAVDLERAARSDRLSDTINYAAIVATVTAAVTGSPPSALGRAAEGVARAILDAHQGVSAAGVTIHMPHASISEMFGDVGVTIVRNRAAQDRRHSSTNPVPANRR